MYTPATDVADAYAKITESNADFVAVIDVLKLPRHIRTALTNITDAISKWLNTSTSATTVILCAESLEKAAITLEAYLSSDAYIAYQIFGEKSNVPYVFNPSRN